jgi:hypothetical protein
MKLLIGNTGLIGTTLKDSISFDHEFNSKNIHELLNLNVDFSKIDLYLCCLPATKWLVNQDPSEDFNNMINIINILSKQKYNNIILYSTIDIYQNAPIHSNESYIPKIDSLNYGNNRYIFEQLVEKTLIYNNLLILRLPSLFGKHLKKNILFDLLNNNEIHKINYNSKYQWYNLDDLVKDTNNCLKITNKFLIINLFPEPIETSEIVKFFKIDKLNLNTTSQEIIYDHTVLSVGGGYIENKHNILKSIEKFINDYYFHKIKIAVCLFGEERDILERLKDWEAFYSKTKSDFFISLYSNDNIHDVLKTIKKSLPVKACFIADNDLQMFDKIKYKSEYPIYIYGVDPKASFNRITSQLYIRQQAISLVNPDEYDVILLCRSDFSKFNISKEDLSKTFRDENLLIVNSGTHTHPGGGGGCTICTHESKCDLEYHKNDICDLWCVGNTSTMKKWSKIYDNVLDIYRSIQKQSPDLENLKHIMYKPNLESNEITINFQSNQIDLIENYIHCFYPEKLMRVLFKDTKIVNASSINELW